MNTTRMTVGGDELRRLSYHYRPAGYEYGPISVEEGTIRFVITGPKGEVADPEPVFIPNVERDAPEWEPSSLGSAWSEKTVRIDRTAKYLIAYRLAHMFTIFNPGKMWVNRAIQEAYCIDGAGWDYVGEVEGFVTLLPGTYIHRPPLETYHGHATTYSVPRRLLVKYYDDDPKDEFMLENLQDIPPPSFTE